MVAHPPGHGALLTGGTSLVGLALDAQVHDVVPADGTVVHHYVPGPQSHSVPLLHLEPFLVLLKIIIIILIQSAVVTSLAAGRSSRNLIVAINIHGSR